MPGDRKAIIGPNGAGKTTLFNLITGIFPSTSGQVLLFGQRRHRAGPATGARRSGMARTFQITHLFPKLTVLDNVLLAIEGLRPSKFVMWRFMSSYRDVYDKAHGLLERASFMDRKDTRSATCRTASSASSRSSSASPAIRKSCCSTSRPPACRPANSPR